MPGSRVPMAVTLRPLRTAQPGWARNGPAVTLLQWTRFMTYCFEVVAPSAIDAGFELAWAALEERALEPNPYLSPDFVLPTLAHLDTQERVRLLVVRRRDAAGTLVALGLFRLSTGSRRMPLPHLQGFLGTHSFLGGLLLDRDQAEPALNAFFDGLRTHAWRWQGLVLERCWSDGPQASLLCRLLEQRKWHHQSFDRLSRAMLQLPLDAEAHLSQLSPSLRQNLRRGRRRLGEQGRVDWVVHRGPAGHAQVVEDFLALEHMGWKGEAGTSLRADPQQERFFRDMTARFARRGRVLFTQINLDGQPVAATSNLVAGGVGFAFKVGWNPAFAKLSPGMLCEAEFLRQAGRDCPDLGLFDSGAMPGSYIDSLWPTRRDTHTWVIATTAAARMAMGMTQVLRATRDIGRRETEGPGGQPVPVAAKLPTGSGQPPIRTATISP